MSQAAGEATRTHLDQIVRAEVEVINRRRTALGRTPVHVAATGPTAPVLDVVGLTLSGGGIRSASFSLGVLQALNEAKALRKVDYLSTVSGGGYIGSALSATMTKSGGDFVFGQTTGARGTDAALTDVMDTPSVGHLRNYSNYLIPFGARDLVTALAIIVRGLIANISLVLPVILLAAAVTIFSNPDRTDLVKPNFFGLGLEWIRLTHFGITLLVALVAFPLFFAWAIYRSFTGANDQSEFRTWLPSLAAAYLILVAVVFFCELQPYVIAGMFDLADEADRSSGGDHSLLAALIKHLAAIAAPIAAIVTFFRQQVGTLLKSVTSGSGITRKLLALGAHVAIWIAGAALPLLIWVGYLYLCFWGIINDGTPVPKQPPRPPAIHGKLELKGPGLDLHGTIDCRASAQNPCGAAPAATPGTKVENDDEARGDHTPKWIINPAGMLSTFYERYIIPPEWKDQKDWLRDRLLWRPVTLLYATFGFLLLLIAWFCLKPNANSLHRLYRDRLSKAFLFDPMRDKTKPAYTDTVDQGRDHPPLDSFRLSELAPPVPGAPYHLINAALNIQGSDYANRRGRNADFFLFSPLYVGSDATGYARTTSLEDNGLDLPTAMAISGAAFSSNMGSKSIRALTPTLALLNVRTGYWLKNPLAVTPPPIGANGKTVHKRFGSRLFLWSEISGRLYENSPDVYITDGGHIENLGVYELLRRRAKIIVVVDAEADPAMRLPSFIALQRYARIDLGVRINMPWDGIRKCTLAWMGFSGTCGACPPDPAPGAAAPAEKPAADGATPAPRPSHGPHAAIGTIDYAGGEVGWLLYIKSSLSGDENDYVRDYARRYDEFPHESTGDQFFSEEQFEVYRALGFHIVSRLLSGEDKLQAFGAVEPVTIAADHPTVTPMREALLG